MNTLVTFNIALPLSKHDENRNKMREKLQKSIAVLSKGASSSVLLDRLVIEKPYFNDYGGLDELFIWKLIQTLLKQKEIPCIPEGSINTSLTAYCASLVPWNPLTPPYSSDDESDPTPFLMCPDQYGAISFFIPEHQLQNAVESLQRSKNIKVLNPREYPSDDWLTCGIQLIPVNSNRWNDLASPPLSKEEAEKTVCNVNANLLESFYEYQPFSLPPTSKDTANRVLAEGRLSLSMLESLVTISLLDAKWQGELYDIVFHTDASHRPIISFDELVLSIQSQMKLNIMEANQAARKLIKGKDCDVLMQSTHLPFSDSMKEAIEQHSRIYLPRKYYVHAVMHCILQRALHSLDS